ncbi:hypothetical protein ACIP88_33815 [Streptomyces uncialis]|uniref:hypothetical protein n=1 Tax=Streptomyces uncialis TaxID=1048205 RepID=UPI0038272C0F
MFTIPHRRRTARAVALAVLVTTAATACTQSPPEHDDRLSKAAGLARVSLVVSKDLWNETKPDGIDNEVTARMEEIAEGPKAGRGLVRVSMSGTNLVAYMKELDSNAHPHALTGDRENTAASRRVYDAVAPGVDRIKAARATDDPQPEIVIDDTIPKSA